MTVRSPLTGAAAALVAVFAVVMPATTAGGDLLSDASELTTTTTVAVAPGDSDLTTVSEETIGVVETNAGTVEETVVEVADETLEPVVDLQKDDEPAPAPAEPTDDSKPDGSAPAGPSDEGDTSGEGANGQRATSPAGSHSPAGLENAPANAPVVAPVEDAPRVPAVARAVAEKANASGASRRNQQLPLEDSDFATGATRPSVTPLLEGAYRSSAPILDLLDGRRLTPRVVASLIAPFPVAGSARYRDIPGATSVTIASGGGVPVIASADGEIGGDVQELVLVGPDDTVYVYGDLDRLSASAAAGGRVSKGDVIGFIDDGGLQFSLHPGGGPAVNPVPYLDRWIAEALQRAQSLAASPAAVQALTQVQRSAPRAAGSEDRPAATAPEAPRLMSLDGAQRIVATTGIPLVGVVALLLGAWGRKRWWRRLVTATTS